jgi:ubiquinone/menaquinone biosynthesis C-methylase UbiE
MANLFLHFGAGPNQLPEPWRNHDKETDISERLPFEDGEARFIFAEHVIEHLPFRDGLRFLAEAYRVLAAGGVLRVAFPDVVKLGVNGSAWLAELKRIGVAKKELELSPHQVPLLAAAGFGHQMAWTEGLMYQLLLAVGFKRVLPMVYGATQYDELRGIDGHHKTSSLVAAELETTVIEATK